MLSKNIIVSRLILSVILGGIIGLEREKSNRAAGLRTHILVSLGSTLIMLISIDSHIRLGITAKWDVGRLAAQVVSGIGFLGAGTILQNDGRIDGLTTAASLWLTAAIGLSVGTGYHLAAIFSSGIVLLTLNSLKKIERSIVREKGERMDISFHEEYFDIDILVEECREHGIKINKMWFSDREELKLVTLCLEVPKDLNKEKFLNNIEGHIIYEE